MVEQMVGHLKLILNSADNYTVQAESTTFQMADHKETSGESDWGFGSRRFAGVEVAGAEIVRFLTDNSRINRLSIAILINSFAIDI